MIRVVLTMEQAQALVNYLADQPYRDVAHHIAAIMEGRQEEGPEAAVVMEGRQEEGPEEEHEPDAAS